MKTPDPQPGIKGEAFGRGQEQRFFELMLQQAEDNLTALSDGEEGSPLHGKTILADTGYFCESNLKIRSGGEFLIIRRLSLQAR